MYEYLKKNFALIDVPVKVLFKNGIKKYGLLIDQAEFPETGTSNYKFVCNSKFAAYKLTESPYLVEYLNEEDILSIDKYLK